MTEIERLAGERDLFAGSAAYFWSLLRQALPYVTDATLTQHIQDALDHDVLRGRFDALTPADPREEVALLRAEIARLRRLLTAVVERSS